MGIIHTCADSFRFTYYQAQLLASSYGKEDNSPFGLFQGQGDGPVGKSVCCASRSIVVRISSPCVNGQARLCVSVILA